MPGTGNARWFVRRTETTEPSAAAPPVSRSFRTLGTTANFNFLDPLGRVDFDSLQLSVNRRFAQGLAFTGAYTYAKGTDWWATGILIPEFRDLNKGPASNVSPEQARPLGVVRIALRRRQTLSNRRYRCGHRRGVAAQRVFHGLLRFDDDHDRQCRVVERAGQRPARRRSQGVRRAGRSWPGQPLVRYDVVCRRHCTRALAHPKRMDIVGPATPTSTPVCFGRSGSHGRSRPRFASRRST